MGAKPVERAVLSTQSHFWVELVQNVQLLSLYHPLPSCESQITRTHWDTPSKDFLIQVMYVGNIQDFF